MTKFLLLTVPWMLGTLFGIVAIFLPVVEKIPALVLFFFCQCTVLWVGLKSVNNP